jgi:hypothetical protein
MISFGEAKDESESLKREAPGLNPSASPNGPPCACTVILMLIPMATVKLYPRKNNEIPRADLDAPRGNYFVSRRAGGDSFMGLVSARDASMKFPPRRSRTSRRAVSNRDARRAR